jgi:hypothetical protein
VSDTTDPYIPWFFPFAAIALLVLATGLRSLIARD